MTVSTSSSSVILFGNGSTTTFDFGFIGVSSSDIQVTYTSAAGVATVLTPTQYTLTLSSPATGALWGVGGTVTLLISGSAPPVGSSVTITRTVPLSQTTSISNQGDFNPQVIEAALDTLEFQIQQVSARGGAYRGIWATGIVYNFGDIVQDGINGANTANIYVCANANTSGTWATDLAAGDWSLAINVSGITGTAGGDLTGSYPSPTIAKIQGTAITGVTGTGNIILSSSALTSSSTATFTNKTFDTAATGNVFKINGTAVSAVQGSTGSVVLSSGQAVIQGGFKNLKGTWASNTTATFTADQVVVQDTSLNALALASYSQTVSTGTSGAGGLDTGSLAAATWYHVYAIYNPTTPATSILISLSSTSPTMPTGYTYKARIGTFYTDNSGNIRGFKQFGRKTRWLVGSNLSGLPSMASGALGSVTVPTWSTVSTANFAPSTASFISVVPHLATATLSILLASNNSYGAYNSSSNPPLVIVSSVAFNKSPAELPLESANIYYASSDSSALVASFGYEDNL